MHGRWRIRKEKAALWKLLFFPLQTVWLWCMGEHLAHWFRKYGCSVVFAYLFWFIQKQSNSTTYWFCHLFFFCCYCLPQSGVECWIPFLCFPEMLRSLWIFLIHRWHCFPVQEFHGTVFLSGQKWFHLYFRSHIVLILFDLYWILVGKENNGSWISPACWFVCALW